MVQVCYNHRIETLYDWLDTLPALAILNLATSASELAYTKTPDQPHQWPLCCSLCDYLGTFAAYGTSLLQSPSSVHVLSAAFWSAMTRTTSAVGVFALFYSPLLVGAAVTHLGFPRNHFFSSLRYT